MKLQFTHYKLTFLTVLLFGSCKIYVHIEPSVKKEFNSIYNTQNLDNEFENLAIVLNYHIDTLNKESFINSGIKFKIIDPDMGTQSFIKNSSYDIFFCKPQLKGNILTIDVASPDFEQTIKNTIKDKNLISVYAESYKGMPILKNLTTDIDKEYIDILVKDRSFTLSDDKFIPGSIYYGKSVIKTVPYYVKNSHFKEGYIKQSIEIEYLFRFKIE